MSLETAAQLEDFAAAVASHLALVHVRPAVVLHVALLARDLAARQALQLLVVAVRARVEDALDLVTFFARLPLS